MLLDKQTTDWLIDNLKWIEDIPIREDFTLYPLQLANAIRIMQNDAVFIFDEVGCGKTISAGIMAKTYLYKNPQMKNEDILVITTNAVKCNQQFEDDWKKIDEKLNPTIYNNLVNSDLSLLSQNRKWGVVIIDEAHEFSNIDTQRYNTLINELRAEKVVFLTATPLRGGGDYKFYVSLANSILGKDIGYSIDDKLKITGSINENLQDLICARFDYNYPITRYFKDTVRYLDIHEKKDKAHRVIPEIWMPEIGDNREITLVKNIERKISENKNSKFVIFVRFRREANLLKEQILEYFYDNDNITFKIIFAEEKERLKDYAKDDPDNPTILILNYQIGEAGVNLPGYDHVIHWHISSDPVRLEQRYGRIDRMTSKHDRIHSCFVIPTKYDSNYSNMIQAIIYTMGELLTSLPARNVLLTDRTLGLYKNRYETKRTQYENDLKSFKSIHIDQYTDVQLKDYYDYDNTDNNTNCSNDPLLNFIKEKGDKIIWNSGKEDISVLRTVIQDAIDKEIRYLERMLCRKDDAEYIKSFEDIIKDIEDRSDQIFYSTEKYNPLTLETIDSQDYGCAKYIQENEEYKTIQKIIKVMDAFRIVMTYAREDVQFAADAFIRIGDIHSFTDEICDPDLISSPNALAYKYKR